jgi:HSP20 family protein
MDVSYDDENILYVYEIPGLKKEDISVIIDDGKVTVSGERKQQYIQYNRTEISHGAFSRCVSLPRGVDTTTAKATYNNGILTLKFRKLQRDSNPQTITVA